MPHETVVPLPLSAALEKARAFHCGVTIVSRPGRAAVPVRVSLTVSDPDPTVALWSGETPPHGGRLLVERQQSGVDRWDYHASLDAPADTVLLRLSDGARTRDVPLLPAAMALLHQHGWGTAAEDAEAHVDETAFEAALHELGRTERLDGIPHLTRVTTPHVEVLPDRVDHPLGDGVRFLPWIGERYTEGLLDGRRLLVLGESHYAWKSGVDTPYLTQWVVERNASRVDTHNKFWTITPRLCAPTAIATDRRERLAFWDSVAFYNFVPSLVGSEPGHRPTPEQWAAGAAPFLAVIERLRPDLVLVIGRETWSHLPGGAELDVSLSAGGITQPVRRWRLEGGHVVVAGGVPHTSRAFSTARWRPWVQRLLVEASGSEAGSPASSPPM